MIPKGTIRRCKSKKADNKIAKRKRKNKIKYNDLQNTTKKTKDWAKKKTGISSCCSTSSTRFVALVLAPYKSNGRNNIDYHFLIVFIKCYDNIFVKVNIILLCFIFQCGWVFLSLTVQFYFIFSGGILNQLHSNEKYTACCVRMQSF